MPPSGRLHLYVLPINNGLQFCMIMVCHKYILFHILISYHQDCSDVKAIDRAMGQMNVVISDKSI